jgi:hypothetical protein
MIRPFNRRMAPGFALCKERHELSEQLRMSQENTSLVINEETSELSRVYSYSILSHVLYITTSRRPSPAV